MEWRYESSSSCSSSSSENFFLPPPFLGAKNFRVRTKSDRGRRNGKRALSVRPIIWQWLHVFSQSATFANPSLRASVFRAALGVIWFSCWKWCHFGATERLVLSLSPLIWRSLSKVTCSVAVIPFCDACRKKELSDIVHCGKAIKKLWSSAAFFVTLTSETDFAKFVLRGHFLRSGNGTQAVFRMYFRDKVLWNKNNLSSPIVGVESGRFLRSPSRLICIMSYPIWFPGHKTENGTSRFTRGFRSISVAKYWKINSTFAIAQTSIRRKKEEIVSQRLFQHMK